MSNVVEVTNSVVDTLYRRAIEDMARYSSDGLHPVVSVIAHTFERSQKDVWNDVLAAGTKLRVERAQRAERRRDRMRWRGC